MFRLCPSLTAWFLIAALLAWVFAGALVGGGLFAYRDAAHYYYPLFQFVFKSAIALGVALLSPRSAGSLPFAVFDEKQWLAFQTTVGTHFLSINTEFEILLRGKSPRRARTSCPCPLMNSPQTRWRG